MVKFKIGDKVRCVSSISPNDNGPIKNEIYTITSVNDNYIGFPLKDLPIYYDTDVKSGKCPNWGVHCFQLVESSTTKHYKWLLFFQDEISKKPIIKKTEHYVSPEKIKSYIDHFKLDHCKDFQMIEDQFVED